MRQNSKCGHRHTKNFTFAGGGIETDLEVLTVDGTDNAYKFANLFEVELVCSVPIEPMKHSACNKGNSLRLRKWNNAGV